MYFVCRNIFFWEFSFYIYSHIPFFCKFISIADQIQYNLLNSRSVKVKHFRNIFIKKYSQNIFGFFKIRNLRHRDFSSTLSNIIGLHIDFKFPCLQFHLIHSPVHLSHQHFAAAYRPRNNLRSFAIIHFLFFF